MSRSADLPARLGTVALDRIGLRRQDVRRLRVPQAWAAVAGDAVVQRVRVSRVARGVLELELIDPSWQDQLASLLPQMVARLAGRYPELGVRSFRLNTPDRPTGASAIPVEPCLDASPKPAPPTRPKTAKTPTSDRSLSERIQCVADRYLVRRTGRSSR